MPLWMGRSEVPLTGAHTPGVVRVGDTVRRPLQPGSARIQLMNGGWRISPAFVPSEFSNLT
jgi:hypothetical protein